ncbi:MAG: DUF3551 domain-containing protein [Alphaproteobacteria bacterium]|nr:MAG: DUF3551 domain-containing protein [Alphaproteobacteria bacterium]
MRLSHWAWLRLCYLRLFTLRNIRGACREGYLYCSYKTQQQCQWTASGIGGCAPNPRLLFPNKPRDSSASNVVPDSR